LATKFEKITGVAPTVENAVEIFSRFCEEDKDFAMLFLTQLEKSRRNTEYLEREQNADDN